MSGLGWADALILWLLFGMAVLWAWAVIAGRMGRIEDEEDHVAESKRRVQRNADRVKWGGR